MIFGIITHAVHKVKDGQIYAYEPYVREMNLWAKYVDEIIIVAPISNDEIERIEIAYHHPKIKVVSIPNFDITSFKNLIKSLLVIPKICWMIYKVMKQVDHIHLRCPGNIGLLGCLVQIFFPSKQKTAKYAGNWDPQSKQPVTYKFQKWLLGNSFLTKKIKVLVYGDWPNQSKNILPFFTASYYESEIEEIEEKDLNKEINLIFVGGLTIGKQPLLSVQAAHKLIKKGYNIRLDMYGDGVMRNQLESYISSNQLENHIVLHGNVDKDEVKKAFQASHFLIFISKSEGWPKVVAEAMFWSCLPISSKVSCIPYMLGNNTRGKVVTSSIENIVEGVEEYILNEELYQLQVTNAKVWSREYTLDKFDKEIEKLLHA
ncbi:glycosyl transferase [Wenyingzhuangia fucanilytica]|uniref:Glycosyl transferase n=1 Tax=Wenyingzhuangia fucanilytica TaxID=1790137 RepID=A0A1B1Y695_9FLAO|nr:glycosyltransferase [Wenyingzhuangia fucanilytica]ANW96296.1 glycosyl transferase [Wenyingzhuangia fucanilytica]